MIWNWQQIVAMFVVTIVLAFMGPDLSDTPTLSQVLNDVNQNINSDNLESVTTTLNEVQDKNYKDFLSDGFVDQMQKDVNEDLDKNYKEFVSDEFFDQMQKDFNENLDKIFNAEREKAVQRFKSAIDKSRKNI